MAWLNRIAAVVAGRSFATGATWLSDTLTREGANVTNNVTNNAKTQLDKVALGTIANSLDDLVHRLSSETKKAGENDEITSALLDVERQLQSCARRLNSTLKKSR